jgi:hypothetical protein
MFWREPGRRHPDRRRGQRLTRRRRDAPDVAIFDVPGGIYASLSLGTVVAEGDDTLAASRPPRRRRRRHPGRDGSDNLLAGLRAMNVLDGLAGGDTLIGGQATICCTAATATMC